MSAPAGAVAPLAPIPSAEQSDFPITPPESQIRIVWSSVSSSWIVTS